MKHILTLSLLLLSFYLGLYNNRLTIFEANGTPVMVLPYKAELYPEQDRQRLRQGIPFETNEELTKLLEDFMS